MVPAENLLAPFDFMLSWTNPSPVASCRLQVSCDKSFMSEVEIYTMLGEKVVVRADNEYGRRIFMNVDYSDPEAEPNVTKWQTLITFPMK
jgi:hypothetical protein